MGFSKDIACIGVAAVPEYILSPLLVGDLSHLNCLALGAGLT